MLKHIGRHNNRKVAVIFHQVPDEDHMCLVVYSDVLPRVIHDEIMKALESPVGQQEKNLGDALHRTLLNDGRNALEVIHKEGFIKKVQTSQVIMTPTPSSQIRLDELNTILAEMATGEDAVKRLAEMDANSGLQNKKRDNTKRDVGEPAAKKTAPITAPLQAGPNDVLTDEMIASQQLVQATKMRNEAASLLKEATRLEAESAALVSAAPKTAVKTTKTKTTKAAAKNDITKETKKAKV